MISSSSKLHDKQTGTTSDPVASALSSASMASAGPDSLGDGSASTSLVPAPDAAIIYKGSRFQKRQ